MKKGKADWFWRIEKAIYRTGPVASVFLGLVAGFCLKVAGIDDKNIIYFSAVYFAAVVGLFNFFINKTKVNLELFKMRFEIYKNCKDIIFEKYTFSHPEKNSYQARQEQSMRVESLVKSIDIDKARLLFDSKTVEFITEICQDVFGLHLFRGTRDGETESRKKRGMKEGNYDDLKKMEEEMLGRIEEKMKALPSVFERYMSFEHIF